MNYTQPNFWTLFIAQLTRVSPSGHPCRGVAPSFSELLHEHPVLNRLSKKAPSKSNVCDRKPCWEGKCDSKKSRGERKGVRLARDSSQRDTSSLEGKASLGRWASFWPGFTEAMLCLANLAPSGWRDILLLCFKFCFKYSPETGWSFQ